MGDINIKTRIYDAESIIYSICKRLQIEYDSYLEQLKSDYVHLRLTESELIKKYENYFNELLEESDDDDDD